MQSDGRPRISMKGRYDQGGIHEDQKASLGMRVLSLELRFVSQWLNSRCPQGAESTSVVSNQGSAIAINADQGNSGQKY